MKRPLNESPPVRTTAVRLILQREFLYPLTGSEQKRGDKIHRIGANM